MIEDKQAKEILTRIEELERRLSRLEEHPQSESLKPAKSLSLREFLNMLRLDGDVERSLAIAYYQERYRQSSSFNVKDIEDGYREAKHAPPTNINDKMYVNIKKGLLMECREKKQGKKTWALTASGEAFIENKLSISKGGIT